MCITGFVTFQDSHRHRNAAERNGNPAATRVEGSCNCRSPRWQKTPPAEADGRQDEVSEMHTSVLTRANGHCNAQFVKKPSRRQGRPASDLTTDVLGTQIRDGARIVIGPEEAQEILDRFWFSGQRKINEGRVRGHVTSILAGEFRGGNRGRSAHFEAPPAQIHTCGLPAYG